MKIDLYISSLSAGGAEHVLTTLAGAFQRAGHTVCVTSLERRPQFYPVPEGVTLLRHSPGQAGGLRAALRAFRAMRRQLKARRDCDVAVAFMRRCNLMLPLCALGLKVRTVVCERNHPRLEHSRLVFWLGCLIYRNASAVVVQTQEAAALYPAWLQSRITVLANPLDTAALAAQCPAEPPARENVVLAMGRLAPQKDFPTLLAAFAGVAQRHPAWQLHLYGQGEQQPALAAQIRALGMQERIRLMGVTHAPYAAMRAAGAFVLTSRYEGFPNVLCEAMHAGLPCLATACPCGVRELIQPEQNGLLAPVGDVPALQAQLERLLMDAPLRARLGAAASAATARLVLPAIRDQWLELLTRVAAKERAV